MIKQKLPKKKPFLFVLNARLLLIPALALGLSLGLGGCSSAKIDPNDPASLMLDAEEEVSSQHYQIAVEKLRTIKNKFPYSKQATLAHLRIGDVYFLEEAFIEAASFYETFADLHPSHEKTPYALFRVGKSHFSTIPSTVARDLTPANKAISAYNEFLRRFPQATDAPEARQDITTALNLLAAKEQYIADFYFKRDAYESAQPRYKKILELYPQTESAKIAKEQLAKIASKLGTRGTDGDEHEPSTQ